MQPDEGDDVAVTVQGGFFREIRQKVVPVAGRAVAKWTKVCYTVFGAMCGHRADGAP
jgi:hypothetical protein